MEATGVALRILDFSGNAVDTRGAVGRLMLNMFAAMARFEREMMLERQREGIAKAKAQGRYKGRKPTARAKAEDAVSLFRQGRKVAHIARELGIGRGSVYRALENVEGLPGSGARMRRSPNELQKPGQGARSETRRISLPVFTIAMTTAVGDTGYVKTARTDYARSSQSTGNTARPPRTSAAANA